jgi:excisionase family DNA binding protein
MRAAKPIPEIPSVAPKVYSVDETRAVTRLGLSTINSLIADGTLKSTRVGRRRLVFVDSVNALLNENAA